MALKRAFDLVVAAFALIALAPLLLITAVAVKADSPGPAIFVQSRPGRGGRPFWMLKFRTMYAHQCDAAGTIQARASDPRVTRVGRFLRKTNIDELPQLFNVLMGHMSIVGPRPHVVGTMAGSVAYEAFLPYYDIRLLMRPGITGWAQANGLRGPTADDRLAQARIDHDIAYIQNFSILLDLWIVALTLRREFFGGRGL
jgi:lipopolysaccharide/colanic/teichoic acid biosynthesis glycosyltransferase